MTNSSDFSVVCQSADDRALVMKFQFNAIRNEWKYAIELLLSCKHHLQVHWPKTGVYKYSPALDKYFSGAVMVFLKTSQASPARRGIR